MGTYTISQLAGRSGFSASALRYYESIGLVVPATRTEAGYRIYDDHTLDQLAFIARAKQLGCSLDEIADLVSVWAGALCGPVQRRFHELVTDKILDAERQISELAALSSQLHTAAEQLSAEPIDGPCGENCACLANSATASDQPAPSPAARDAKPVDPPIACTLNPTALPARIDDWRALIGRANAHTRNAGGTHRVDFSDGVDLTELTRLVAGERDCCSFFSFAITVDSRGVALEISAPDGADYLVADLFGQPA